MEAPRWRVRWDGAARSFVCSAATFLRLWNMEPHRSPEELTFALLNAIMNGRLKVDRLYVRQVPLLLPPRRVAPVPGAIALLIAHPGRWPTSGPPRLPLPRPPSGA